MKRRRAGVDAIEAYREACRKTSGPLERAVALESKRIPPAEDSATNRGIVTELLEEAGLSVETAEGGEPAPRAVPVIALSANAFEEGRKKALRSGMSAHIPKPIDEKMLLKP